MPSVGSPGIHMGEMPEPFRFRPTAGMTPEELEDYYLEYQRHVSTAMGSDLYDDEDGMDTVEMKPSVVFDPDSPAYQRQATREEERMAAIVAEIEAERDRARQSSSNFVEGLGHVVEGEDYDALLSSGHLSDEAREEIAARRSPRPLYRILQKSEERVLSRPATAAEVYRAKMSRMAPPERDAEERFGDIV